MKNMFFIVLSILFVAQMSEAKAPKALTKNQIICREIEYKVYNDCAHLACDSQVSEGIFKDIDACTSASDYAEYAQGVCGALPTIENLIKEYNQKNPKANLICE